MCIILRIYMRRITKLFLQGNRDFFKEFRVIPLELFKIPIFASDFNVCSIKIERITHSSEKCGQSCRTTTDNKCF